MKNPQTIYIPKDKELVKFSGFIVHVDTANEKFNRLCFKEDTKDKESALVSVNAWKSENGPDLKALTNDAKGRFATVIASKSVSNKDGKEYTNYTVQSIDFAPTAKNS